MVPRGDNWTNWRTLPSDLRAKEVRSGLAVLIASGFYFTATSCEVCIRKSSTFREECFPHALWKGFQFTLSPWDVPTLSLGLKCLIKHSLFGQLQQNARVTEGWEWRRTRRQITPPDLFVINEAPPRRLKVVLATYKVFSRRQTCLYTLLILAVILIIFPVSRNTCYLQTI